MMKVVISGYGRMGHMVEAALKEKGIECAGASEDIASFDKELAKECVCIDFTWPEAFRANYNVWLICYDKKYFDVEGCFKKYGQIYWRHKAGVQNVQKGDVAYLYSSSPESAIRFKVEVVESQMGLSPDVASVRVGELAGTHTVGFEGACDRITVEHEAFSRKGFAEGAVVAALMTEGLTGVHEFKELFYSEDFV